ncbi:MAG: LEA type 2 family protein [Janthinobacterium lividum]
MRVTFAVVLLSCGLSGCAAVQPPQVDVLQARLSSVGLLDQQLQVQLCISNPNSRELAFSRVTFNVDVGGERLASGVNDSPVTLPPMQSVSLPFSVATTTRNLGAQLGSIFSSAAIPYSVSGHIVLRDFSLIGIPYSVSGRVTPANLAAGLVSVAGNANTPGACNAVEPVRPSF